MKLFLASSLDQTLPFLSKRISAPPAEIKVLFIANAADSYTDIWWVDADKKKFLDLGYPVTDFDLRNTSTDTFSEALKDHDILHICGGSVFCILSLLKEKGISHIIANCVRENEIIYTGTSAGSIIAAPSVHLYADDEEEKKFITNETDFKGIGLVNFLIIPHASRKKFTSSNLNMVAHLPENKLPLIFLNDNQAVWVEDKKIEIISL